MMLTPNADARRLRHFPLASTPLVSSGPDVVPSPPSLTPFKQPDIMLPSSTSWLPSTLSTLARRTNSHKRLKRSEESSHGHQQAQKRTTQSCSILPQSMAGGGGRPLPFALGQKKTTSASSILHPYSRQNSAAMLNGDRCLQGSRQSASTSSLKSNQSSTASLRGMPDLLPKRSRRRLHERNKKQQSSGSQVDRRQVNDVAMDVNERLHDSSGDKENVPSGGDGVNRSVSRLSIGSSDDNRRQLSVVPLHFSSARLGMLLQRAHRRPAAASDSMSNFLEVPAVAASNSGSFANGSGNETLPLTDVLSQSASKNNEGVVESAGTPDNNAQSRLQPPVNGEFGGIRTRQSKRFPLRHRQHGQRPPATSVSGVLQLHHEAMEEDVNRQRKRGRDSLVGAGVGSKSNMLVVSEEDESDFSTDEEEQSLSEKAELFVSPVPAECSDCSVTLLVSTPLNAAPPPPRNVHLSNVLTPLDQNIGHQNSSVNDAPRPQHRLRKYQAVTRLNASDMATPEADWEDSEAGLSHLHDDSEYSLVRSAETKKRGGLRERRLLAGVKQFNLDPEKGLKYLEDCGFVKLDNPDSVAQFLFRQERLSKKQIGKYLGGHRDFNKMVLKSFVHCHEFTHLLLVEALRQFLWSFRLPGEAMQIDRIMDTFASHYCEQNPNIFKEPDTCFILSFSIIMLNTALHNPNSNMKVSAEMFVKQNKGINSGKDLPSDMLEAIFRNIKEEPFKIPDETYDDLMYTFFSPEKEGWLLKQGGGWKTWKRRWFVLNDRCLYCFQHTSETAPKGIIPLENVRVRSIEDKDLKHWILEIYSDESDIIKGCKTDSNGTVVQGNHRYYRMSASTKEERDSWISAIQDSIRDNPFQRIIAKKVAARSSRGSIISTLASQ